MRLFRALARGDGRVARLARLVRTWALRRRLLDGRQQVSNTRARARARARAGEGPGGLSSFGWLLLCARSLQGSPAAPSATPQDTQRQGALPVLDAELMRKLEAADVLAMQGAAGAAAPAAAAMLGSGRATVEGETGDGMSAPLPGDASAPTGERRRAMQGKASGSVSDEDSVTHAAGGGDSDPGSCLRVRAKRRAGSRDRGCGGRLLQEGVACSAGGEAAGQGDAELLLDFFIFYGRLRPLLALPPAAAAPCSDPCSSALPGACAGTHARLLAADERHFRHDHDCLETSRVSKDLESHAPSACARAPPHTLNASVALRASETPVVISLLDRHLPLGRALRAAGAGACDAALWIQDPVDVSYNVARGMTPALLLRLQCEIQRAMLVLAAPDSPLC